MKRVLILAALAAATAAAQTCDRACLEGMVDRYMEALIAHDPAKIPTAQRVKNTEDGVQLELGDGFWRSARAKGSYRFFVTDVESGQVVFLGTMREDPSNPVIISIRLKVQNQRISEIETVTIRDAAAAIAFENRGRPQQVFLDPIPAAQRASRGNLIRVANSYLDNLPKRDGSISPPIATASKTACRRPTIRTSPRSRKQPLVLQRLRDAEERRRKANSKPSSRRQNNKQKANKRPRRHRRRSSTSRP